jgi:methionyl-tRNA formyltransferase
MDITVLCSSEDHPVNPWLEKWIKENFDHHKIELVRKKAEMPGGDLLFLVSCSEIIKKADRQKYKKALVIHASDLPRGRGWSPHVWQIIEGESTLCVTLLEAEDKVDSGDIWHQMNVDIPKHFLFDEINNALFDAELSLMDFALHNFDLVIPQKQSEVIPPTYFAKRVPDDSQIDPELSIKSQFDLIRVCDTERFPAFIEMYGNKYAIKLEKIGNE